VSSPIIISLLTSFLLVMTQRGIFCSTSLQTGRCLEYGHFRTPATMPTRRGRGRDSFFWGGGEARGVWDVVSVINIQAHLRCMTQSGMSCVAEGAEQVPARLQARLSAVKEMPCRGARTTRQSIKKYYMLSSLSFPSLRASSLFLSLPLFSLPPRQDGCRERRGRRGASTCDTKQAQARVRMPEKCAHATHQDLRRVHCS